MYQATKKGGENLADTKKSRADYFRKRRKEQYIFYASIEKDKGTILEHELEATKQTKTEWLLEKIAEIDNKKN